MDLDIIEPEVQDFSVFRGNSGVSLFLLSFKLKVFWVLKLWQRWRILYLHLCMLICVFVVVFVFVFVWTYSAHSICGDTLDKIFGVTVDKYELIQKSEAVAISIWVRDKYTHCYGNTWEFDKKNSGQIVFLGVRLPICLGTSSKQFSFCSICSWRSCVIESFLHKKQWITSCHELRRYLW